MDRPDDAANLTTKETLDGPETGSNDSHDGAVDADAVQPVRQAVSVEAVRVRAHGSQGCADHQGQVEAGQALTPHDAALLAEAEKYFGHFDGVGSVSLVDRLSTALRSALQREQEMRIDAALRRNDCREHMQYLAHTAERASRAERELSTLKAQQEGK